MSYQQPPAPQLNDTLFTKIDDFEARIRVLERQGFDATVGGPAGTAGGDLSGTYPNPKVVRAAGNFNAGDNITSNSGEAGQVRLGARGSGGEIAVGAPTDSYVYRKAAGVIGVDNYIDANLGLRIGGNTLASTHLSDSADILRGSGLAAQQYIFTGAGPTGPSVTVSPLGFNPGGSGQTALLLRSGSDTGATGNAQIAFGYDETNTMMHRIGTRHNPAAQANNAIDFYVWQRAVDSTTALGTQHVMTLDSTGSSITGGLAINTGKLVVQPTGAPAIANMLDVTPGGGVADTAYMTVMGRARFGYSATGSININDAGTSKTFRLELGAANNLVMSMNTAGQMALPGQGTAGGLLIGGDTNLYWNASNQLRTDDLLITVGLRSTANASYGFRSEQAAGNVAYGNVLLSTDANYAFQITGQGTHQWGAGGASPVDTVLYRAAADVLGTDDEFLINRPVIAGHYAPILTWGARRFWRNSSGSTAESSFAQWSVANTRWEAANTSTIIGPGVIETSYANPTWKFRTAGIASFTQGDPLTFVDALVIASTGAVGFGLTPTAGRLQLLADTTAAGGIYFGGDTNLYRGAANVLQTSGNFSMGSAATRDALLTNQGWDIRYRTAAQATSVLYGVRIDSEPNYRFYFDANGKHQWGDGTATPDTTLYRSAADQLQTDDKFVVNHPAGYGIIVLTPSGYTSLTARVQADTNDRVSIEPAASRINFGSGSATVDTNLYRLQADILKTDDALQVALALTTLNGQITATRSSTGVGAFAAYVTGDANPRFKITPTSAGAQLEWGDGTAVPDVIMTRAAADWLDIQDRFSSSRALATDAAFLTRVAGVNQWYIRADGYMTWYDAAGVPDTTLYRGAADVLRTDDQFQSVRTNATDSAFLAQATGLGGFGTFLVRADGYLEWGSGAAARDTSIYRTVQHTLAGLETSAPIRIIRVGVSNQHVQLTPGDASANYIDSWTSEANKKPLIFRTLHGSEGTPAGGQGFAWWVGPSATPTAVMSLSDTGNLNVQGASAGYSIAGVALYSKHLSDQANIAMLNEAEVIVGGWTYTTLATTFRSSVQFREAGGAGSPRMDIVVGTVASPAYLAWYNAAGLRKTYLGFGTDTTTDFQAENGARIGFNQGAATLAAEQNAVSFSGSGLQTFSANVVNQRMIQFNPPAAYAGDVAGRTITTAATVNIAGAPTAGTNMAITNLYSLWVSAGTTRVDGLLSLANGTNTAATGLQFGADVALYRNTTDVLMTDDRFIIQAASAGANAFTIRVAGQNALNVAGSGQLQWSDGIGGSLDTFLQREAAARLLANPDLRVSRWFAVGSTAGSLYLPFRNIQSWNDDVATTRYGFHNQTHIHPVNNLADTAYGILNELRTYDDVATANITGTQIGIGSSFIQMNTAATPRDLSGTVEAIRATITYSGVGPFGNMGSVIGFRSVATTPASGTWSSRYGLYVDGATVTAGGAITSTYGIRILNQGNAAVTNAYGIYIDDTSGATVGNRSIYVVAGQVRIGSTVPNAKLALGQDWTAGSLQFAADTTAAGGIYFGSDTTLYRQAAGALQTDGTFRVTRPLGTDYAYYTVASADTSNRFAIRADGQMEWGAGVAGRDAYLARTQAAMLGLTTGTMLDLSSAGGTAVSTGGIIGDKISFYTNTYGIGVQSSRMVAWMTASGAFSIRPDSAVGQHSSGTDAIALFASGVITSTGAGKNAFQLTNTGTTTGMTLGGDVTLYRNAVNVLRTDDLFQMDQNSVTLNLGDINTYGLGLFRSATGDFGIGSSSVAAWMQSFGKPLRLNSQGQLVYVDSGLSIAGGLTVTSGTITFPTSSLNGNAIMDGTLPIGAFGFIFGGNNLLYNSGFEAAAVNDADPNSVAFQPWDGWFFNNATPSLLTRPTSETRASVTLPQATIGIKNAANWTAPGTARMGATTFTFTSITTDADGLVTLTGCSGGTGTFSANTPITQDPQGVDANRIVGMGNNAVRLTATASGVLTYMAPTPTRYVPVEPLKSYTGSVYLGANAAGKNAAVSIIWYDATRTATGSQPTSAYQAVSSTGMSRLYVTGIAPAGAAYARVYPVFQAATVVAGDVYYVDSAMFSDGDMLFAYEPRADEILPGSINATMIQAGAITGDAIVANFSITGKRIQTAPSGQRVVLEGDSASTLGEAGLGVYGPGGVLRVRLGELTGMTLFSTAGISDPVLKLASTGGLMVGSPTGARTIFDLSGVSTYDSTPTLRVRMDAASGLTLRDTSSNVQVQLSGSGGLQTLGSGGSVFFDSTGLTGYNSTTTFTTATQVIQIDRNTGKLIMGAPSGAFRMEADRVSMRFYDSAGTLGLYTDFGGLRTSSTTTYTLLDSNGLHMVTAGVERVLLDGTAGLTLKDNAGVARVVLSTDGGLKTTGATGTVILNDSGLTGYNSPTTLDATTQTTRIDRVTGSLIIGPPTAAARIEADRTSMRFFQSDGTTVGLYARAGMVSTAASSAGARIDIDGATDTIGIYSSTQPRVTLDPTNGLRLHDTSGVAKVFLSALGGLTTQAAETANRVTLNSSGLVGYDATNAQSVLIDAATGKAIFGNPTGARMEADRTSIRFYDASQVQQFSVISGVLTTGTADTGARVRMWSGGIAAYDASSVQRFLIDAASGLITLRDTAAVPRMQLSTTGGLKSFTGTGGTVIVDDTGIGGYTGQTMSAAEQTFKLDRASGVLTIGQPSPARRMEADRTSLRFFDDSNVQQFSIINGVLTTGTADSGARVRLDSAGIKAYNAAGVNTVQINSTGTAFFSNIGGANLLPNSNAQVFPGGWTGYQGTLANETGIVKFGANSLKLTVTTAPGQIYYSTGLTYKCPKVEPNKTYTFSCWVLATVAARNAQVISRFADAAGGVLAAGSPNTWNYLQGPNVTMSTTDWTRLQVTGIAPPLAKMSGIVVNFPNSQVGDVIYATGFQIEEGEFATAYSPDIANTLSEVSIDAGVLTAGTLRGTTFETSANVNVSKVMFDATGLRGYDAAAQSFNLATTGLLTLGNVSPGARMEADRTSFRYYNASNLVQFSIIGGVLTTAAATGARVELSSAGLKAFNAGGTNTVAINTDGSASFRGAIDLTNSTYSGTVPGATILTPGSVTTNLLTLTVGGQNLFPQSSGPMDGTLTGWNLYNNGVSPAPAYDNFATTTSRYSGRVFRITNSTGITGQAGITVPTANMPRVTAGKTYTWSAWVYPSSATTVTTHIHWRDAGLAIIGSGSAAVSALLPANTWSRIWTTAAAPTTPGIAVNASPYVWFNNLASGATYYIEGLQFEDGDIPTSYNPSPSEIPAGSTIQSSYSVNLSKVMMDATGLRGYDGTGQTFNLATTGLLTLGQPSPARRMESDRTSFRYYTDANVQNFSIINGVLTTGAADSGARIRLDNTSLLGYDATGQVFSLTTAGVLSLGAPSAAARVDVDRTSMRFLQSDGTTVGLYARAGILSTTATATGARVEVDGAADKIAIYSSTQERVTLETVQGLTLRDSSGVARLYLSALGGLTTVAADTAQRVTLNGLGLLAYDTGGLQTVNIESATGRIQIGNPAGQRMEATRTALGFYDSTNVLRLSLGASGGLTTQAAETSQRVSLTSAGLVSYNTSNQQTVLIDAATGKIILGPPSGAARIEADRTSMTFYQSDGLTAGLVATAGKVVSNTSVAVARVEFDGVVNQFAAYDTVRQRLGIDGTNGLRLWDAAGVLGLQSSAGGLITGTTGNRAELLGDGLTLYTSDVRSIKLDASTGKLIAGINDTGVRIEIDNAGLRSYDINNVLGLHTSNYGGITAGDPNTYAEMDKYGMRAVGTGGRTANTTFEVFTDGIRDAIFKTGIDVGGVIALGISTDNIIHDENKLGWYDTSANQIAYVGAAMSAGQGTYGNAVAFSSGVVNYWRFQETSGTTVWDTVGSANLSLVAPYTQGTASLVANDTNDKSYTFTGGYAYIPVSYGEDAFDGGTIGANLNARTALYGGAWATLGATGDYTLYGNITPSNVIRTTSNDASGRFAILGTTSFGAESLVETNISFDFTSNASGKLEMGLVARYVDANNYLRAVYRRDSTDPVTNWKAQIVKVKAGVETILATGTPPSGWGAQYSGKLSLSITNGYNIQFTARVGPNQVVVSSTAYDSDLSSGALSTGKTGLYDILTGPGSGTKARFFYDFKSSVPSKNFQQQNLTFEAWLKPTTVDATDRIIWEVVEPSLTRDNSGLRITHSTAGIKIWTVVGGVWKLCTTVAGALSTSTQTHIAVSLISFLRAKVWKNGVIASTYTPAGGSQAQSDLQLSGSGAGQLSIGASSAGTLQYLGVMDDMVFYQTEVSDSIIANHYNIGNQGATPLASIKARVRVPGGTEYIRTVLDESGNSDFALKTDIPVIPAGVGSGMDFTTPAGNYTTTTTLTPLTWFCTVAAGPNQEWDLDATLGVQATTATWGKVNARIIGQSNAGGALPAGATVDLNHISSVATNNAWSGAIALFAKARLITTGAFVAQTLRIMCEVQHVTAVNTVIRDGNTVRVWARRMV